MDIKSRWKSFADREKWSARGAALMGKVKATKMVWFPPSPAGAGKKAARTAKTKTKRGTTKTSGTVKAATGAAKKSTKKTA